MVNKYYFDKKTANILKGIAILLMMLMHFFTYPIWYEDVISFPKEEFIFLHLREVTRMCVGIFAFLTGFAFCINEDRKFTYVLKKIRNIFITYWIFFIPIMGLAVGSGGKGTLSVAKMVREFFAVDSSTMYFCWYVIFYSISIVILWAIRPLLDRSKGTGILWGIFGVQAVLVMLLGRASNDYVAIHARNLVDWFILLPTGYMIARYKVFEKYDEIIGGVIKAKGLRLCFAFIALALSLMGRYYLPRINLGAVIPTNEYGLDYSFNLMIVYAPVFVFSVIDIVKILGEKWPAKVLEYLGRHSMYMWFFSCIFFGEGVRDIFQKILYLPKISVLVYIWGVGICLAVSIPVKLVMDKLLKK